MDFSIDYKNINGDYCIVFEKNNITKNINTILDKQGIELLLEDIENFIYENETNITDLFVKKFNQNIKIIIETENENVEQSFEMNTYLDDDFDCSIQYKKNNKPNDWK